MSSPVPIHCVVALVVVVLIIVGAVANHFRGDE